MGIEPTPTGSDLGGNVTYRSVAAVLVSQCTDGNSIPVTMIYCMLHRSKWSPHTFKPFININITYIFFNGRILQPFMKSEILSIGRYFSVYFLIHLFLHNLGVLNSSLSNDILYLVTFTFKLAKQKMAAEMLIKPHIFYRLSHMRVQFMVSVRFLFEKFISSVLGKK